jgi:hypothetical protein
MSLLTLRRNLPRPLSWDELDDNLVLLEISLWSYNSYMAGQYVAIKGNNYNGDFIAIYRCETTHNRTVYDDNSQNFKTEHGLTILWLPVGGGSGSGGGDISTLSNLGSGEGIYRNEVAGTAYLKTLKKLDGYNDVLISSDADHIYLGVNTNLNMTGSTLTIGTTQSLNINDIYIDTQNNSLNGGLSTSKTIKLDFDDDFTDVLGVMTYTLNQNDIKYNNISIIIGDYSGTPPLTNKNYSLVLPDPNFVYDLTNLRITVTLKNFINVPNTYFFNVSSGGYSTIESINTNTVGDNFNLEPGETIEIIYDGVSYIVIRENKRQYIVFDPDNPTNNLSGYINR